MNRALPLVPKSNNFVTFRVQHPAQIVAIPKYETNGQARASLPNKIQG